MDNDLHSEIYEDLTTGPGRYRYTHRAFRALPVLDNPRILDVGCGAGGPTLELAGLSKGRVVGMDVDEPALKTLMRKIAEAELSDRVQVVRGSMFNIGFREKSFDIIWVEGAIFVIGFERGLREWRQLIRPGGFLVVHEMIWLRPNPPPEIYSHWKRRYPGICSVPECLAWILACGYHLAGHFALPEEAWWTEYYGPLESRVQGLREKYAGNPETLVMLDRAQQEIDLYKRCQKWYGSAFFMMQVADSVSR